MKKLSEKEIAEFISCTFTAFSTNRTHEIMLEQWKGLDKALNMITAHLIDFDRRLKKLESKRRKKIEEV